MKRFSLIILVALISFSCKKENSNKTTRKFTPRTLEDIKIKEFKIDSISIRAIVPLSKNKVVFTGSNGSVGIVNNNGNFEQLKKLKFNDSIVPNFRSLAVINNTFFALSIGNPALLYKISDAKSELVYKEEHDKVFYDSMKFFDDEKHGIAVGDPTEDCASIILTSDGGNTWKKLPCSQLPKIEKDEAFFAASNTNIAIVDKTVWIASGGSKARILKSTDYGNTWKIYNTPVIQGDGPQGIYSIDFYDENNGIAIGGNYAKPNDNCANKAITSDGGKTWTIVADNQNPNYKSCVQYVPYTNGKEVFAVGKTGVSFSNDGGHTWTEVSNDSYYTIQFVDSNIAWLSGHEKIGKLVLN